MREAIFLLIGLFIGGAVGVVMMCFLQINRINYYERKIIKLQRELVAATGKSYRSRRRENDKCNRAQ